ncbi:MAG TPA: alpha/beta fold hydrolase [Longimicrobiales bacterium]|nr:alpha/beta fold hydrolase [Longimicrobiales bacterium]
MDATAYEPRPFRPAPWAPGPHAQTLLARVLRPELALAVERERLLTPDDDFLDLDWLPEPEPGAPLALLVHGLEGSAERRYVRNVAAELLGRGVRPVALNLRGCSGEPNRALCYYHSGKTDDVEHVLSTLRARHPERRVGGVGFSLGGNVILKLMGERADGGRALLDAAVAMSVPYDLAAGSRWLERSTMGRFYAAYFLRSLKGKLEAKADRVARVIHLEAARACRTIWAFDDLVTAPLHGFESAAHYYDVSSSARYLGGVRVPTLLLHAEDDPFLPPDRIPREIAAHNPALRMLLEPRGGHVGFLAGAPARPRFWGDEEAARFLACALGAAPRAGRRRAPEHEFLDGPGGSFYRSRRAGGVTRGKRGPTGT